jgi:hypothetical protein
MKKILMIVLGLILISSCCIKHKEDREDVHRVKSGIVFVGRFDFNQNGMNYSIYREVDGGLVVINWTKDSLEAEVAKKELQLK